MIRHDISELGKSGFRDYFIFSNLLDQEIKTFKLSYLGKRKFVIILSGALRTSESLFDLCRNLHFRIAQTSFKEYRPYIDFPDENAFFYNYNVDDSFEIKGELKSVELPIASLPIPIPLPRRNR